MLLLSLALLLAPLDSAAVRDIRVADGETLRITEMGEGRPVILLPGIFGGAYSWRKITGPLVAQGYRTIVIEPLGYGSSSHPKKADYSYDAQSKRVARTLEHLGIRRALVMNQATASGIAFRLGIDRPDLVRGVLSIDGGPAETPASQEMKRLFRFGIWPIKLMMDVSRARHDLRDELTSNSGDPSWVNDDVVNHYAAGQIRDLDGSLDALHQMSKVKEADSLAERLYRCTIPVTLLIGAAPHRLPVQPQEIDLLKRRIRRFTAQPVPGAGQYIQEEKPDVVIQALRSLDRAAQ
jgi:pimeloyl-ACP methyl ester carboxylesterase